MIPIVGNIPLAVGSVVIRRFIDSYTGQIPLAVASGSSIPAAPGVLLGTGALIYIYRQLNKGTLVNVGLGKRLSSIIKNSRHTIQRHVKNNSWIMRSLAACRSQCTEAMFRLMRQSNDSLQNVRAETGIIIEANRRNSTRQEPPLEKLYSNQSFDSCDYSNHDLQPEPPKRERQVSNSKRRGYSSTANRPITRNFRKGIQDNNCCGDNQARISPKKRKKSDYVVNEPQEQPVPCIRSHAEVRQNPLKSQTRNFRRDSLQLEVPTKFFSRRYQEGINMHQKIQKITRKTRSGKVYAYRL